MVIDYKLVTPTEAKDKPAKMEPKKYLVIKNHVREICESSESIISKNSENPCVETNESLHKSKKRKKLEKQSSSDDSVNVNNNTEEISKSDLNELRSVYNHCKAVLLKMESKYGHLLELDKCQLGKRKHDQYECKCSTKNKVVFNDDGNTTQYVESVLEHHICPNRLKPYNRYHPVQVETEVLNITLPDTIKELEEMLKNPSLSTTLRKKVIEKIKYIRQDNFNLIRFDKQVIIEQLKSNPDELLDFKGTNFSFIEGYPNKPV